MSVFKLSVWDKPLVLTGKQWDNPLISQRGNLDVIGSRTKITSCELCEGFFFFFCTYSRISDSCSAAGTWRPARDSSLHWLCSSWWGQCSPRDFGQRSQRGAQPPPGSLLSPSLLHQHSQSPRSLQTSHRPSWAHPPCILTAPESVYAPQAIQILLTARTGTSVWSLSSHLEPTTCICRTTTSQSWRKSHSSMPLRSAGSTWLITAFIK